MQYLFGYMDVCTLLCNGTLSAAVTKIMLIILVLKFENQNYNWFLIAGKNYLHIHIKKLLKLKLYDIKLSQSILKLIIVFS